MDVTESDVEYVSGVFGSGVIASKFVARKLSSLFFILFAVGWLLLVIVVTSWGRDAPTWP